MGNYLAKLRLFEAIDRKDIPKAKEIIDKNTWIINEFFDKNKLCFPLIKAV